MKNRYENKSQGRDLSAISLFTLSLPCAVLEVDPGTNRSIYLWKDPSLLPLPAEGCDYEGKEISTSHLSEKSSHFCESAELSCQMFTPEAIKMMLEEETCLVSPVLDKTMGNRALARTTSMGLHWRVQRGDLNPSLPTNVFCSVYMVVI